MTGKFTVSPGIPDGVHGPFSMTVRLEIRNGEVVAVHPENDVRVKVETRDASPGQIADYVWLESTTPR